jgi:phage terminase small subunit
MAKETITKNMRDYIKWRIAGKTQRQAYILAYPRSKNWRIESIDSVASRLEKNVKVASRLKQGRERAIEMAMEDGIVEGVDVIRELARVAFSKKTDYAYIKGGKVIIRDTEDVPEEKLGAIKSIQETMHGIKIELWDKPRALRALGEVVQIFRDREPGEEFEDDGFLRAMSDGAAAVWSDEVIETEISDAEVLNAEVEADK